jgi:hypothetical protein
MKKDSDVSLFQAAKVLLLLGFLVVLVRGCNNPTPQRGNAMSHIVTIKSQLRDPAAISAACRRLSLAEPVRGVAQLYAGQTAEGLLVQLPGWKYPVAIDTTSGEVRHDNFDGYWGENIQLTRFLQAYAIEKCRIEARSKGLLVSETQLQDGSVKLQIQEGR